MSLSAVSSSGSASRNESGRLAQSWRPGPRGKVPRSSSSRASTAAAAAVIAGAQAGREQLRHQVAQQDLNLAYRPDLAEELRRGVGNLVRLIEDDGFRARQQIAESLLLEGEIREQQMVIHDDDVGRLGVAPRLEYMATGELGE